MDDSVNASVSPFEYFDCEVAGAESAGFSISCRRHIPSQTTVFESVESKASRGL